MNTRQKFVVNDAVLENIGALIDFKAEQLFRSLISRRSAWQFTIIDRTRKPPETDIQNLHQSIRKNHNLGRLHIAVYDADPMRILEACRQLLHDFRLLKERYRSRLRDEVF